MSQESSPQPIKLSFRLLLAGLVLIFGLGVVGGFVGQQVDRPTIALPAGSGDRFVTNVQQITVSPNKNMAQIVATLERSIVLIAQTTPTGSLAQATGVVLTNDGLIATATSLTSASFSAIDQTGAAQPLEQVGADAVYGLTYFRLKNAIVVPIDIATDEPSVGAQLLGIGRSPDTLASQAQPFALATYVTPPEASAPAIQRLMKSQTNVAALLPGTPIVTDDGKVAGLLLNAASGLALRASDLKESIDRVIATKREYNPFASVGINVTYSFAPNATSGQREFTVSVGSIVAGSPAAAAGLKPQDKITKVNSDPVTWAQNIAKQLSQNLPLTVTLVHAGQEKTATLNQGGAAPSL